MVFGYAFVNLDEEQKHVRRALLEFYPLVAQLSVLVILGLFQIFFAISWLSNRLQNSKRPKSPTFIEGLPRKSGWLPRCQHAFESLRWWMRNPVMTDWGTRGGWILGGAWTLWLLFLCVVQTGNDYLHLTKRFGIIGASQLPLLYLLAMRSPKSIFQVLIRMSHEELKASHQILGRIIFFLFSLHTIFYLNFFVVSGFLSKRIKDKDVVFGIVSILLFSVLTTTALGFLRRWSYRAFYMTHVVLSNMLVVPLFFHVSHVRPYVYEIMLLNAVQLFQRFRSTTVYTGTIKQNPGTNLVQVQIPLRAGDEALDWKPGQHVYLTRPLGKSESASALGELVRRLQTNPFTVASIPAKDKELVLVARTLNGNTRRLASLARSLSKNEFDQASGTELALEGPYGSSIHLPDFQEFDNILFVAGGVGATFIVPIYRSVVESNNFLRLGAPKVRFIWTVRKLAEANWALGASHSGENAIDSSIHNSVVELFVTRPSGGNLQVERSTNEIELAEDEHLLSMEEQMAKPVEGVVIRAGRPRLSAIVDEFLHQSGKTAVFTCGPKTMTRQLGDAVEHWVRKGQEVYWHEETFGW